MDLQAKVGDIKSLAYIRRVTSNGSVVSEGGGTDCG
jgi:hypothetical protein